MIFKFLFLVFRAFYAQKKPLAAALSVCNGIILKRQFLFQFQHEIHDSK